MKMPEQIDTALLAPCGMNCIVCYKMVGIRQYAKTCAGCLKGDSGKPEHCRKCKIKACAQDKNLTRCFECSGFPCKLIKNLDKSYVKRYAVSLVSNALAAKETGVSEFLEQDRKKWTCLDCGGAFSLHDGLCSECGNQKRP